MDRELNRRSFFGSIIFLLFPVTIQIKQNDTNLHQKEIVDIIFAHFYYSLSHNSLTGFNFRYVKKINDIGGIYAYQNFGLFFLILVFFCFILSFYDSEFQDFYENISYKTLMGLGVVTWLMITSETSSDESYQELGIQVYNFPLSLILFFLFANLFRSPKKKQSKNIKDLDSL